MLLINLNKRTSFAVKFHCSCNHHADFNSVDTFGSRSDSKLCTVPYNSIGTPNTTRNFLRNVGPGPFLVVVNQTLNNMDNNNAATQPEGPNVFKQAIAEQLATIAGIQVHEAITTIEDCKKDGDYSVPVPKMNKFKKVQGNPNQIAKTWCEQFKKTDLITDIACDGIYLNFKINKMVEIEQLVSQIWKQKENYGSTTQGEGKTVIVEYSSPNIAKPFHAGHLRSTIIGNFLKQLHKALGFNAVGINYLGDWGKQYGVLAVGFQKYGDREQLQNNPIKHLYDIYVKINADKKDDPSIDDTARAYFKKMEQGDEEALKLWQEFRDLSIVEYKKMYHRLNVEFDEYSGESKFSKEMEHEVSVLEQKGLLQDEEGAKVVDLKEQKLGVALVKKKDGATLYITRDIAAAHSRKEKYQFSKMIYVVAAQQDLHFKQLFTILDKMGYNWVKECVHINFGMVKGMSTRRGTVIFLQDILDEAKSKMKEVMQKNEAKYKEIEDPDTVADIIGLSAVVIQDLGARRIKDYDFDWDRMTSFEGDTGPYLQFSHARLCSMERKAKDQGIEINPNANLKLLVEKEAQELFSVVGKFPAAIQNSYASFEPCVIVTYAMSLSHAISLAVEKIRVLGQEKELAETRMLMYWCARMALNHALRILGLIPLERM